MARERVTLDEKLRSIEQHKTELSAAGHVDATTAQPGKPVRGRWLTRLGLKDLDE